MEKFWADSLAGKVSEEEWVAELESPESLTRKCYSGLKPHSHDNEGVGVIYMMLLLHGHRSKDDKKRLTALKICKRLAQCPWWSPYKETNMKNVRFAFEDSDKVESMIMKTGDPELLDAFFGHREAPDYAGTGTGYDGGRYQDLPKLAAVVGAPLITWRIMLDKYKMIFDVNSHYHQPPLQQYILRVGKEDLEDEQEEIKEIITLILAQPELKNYVYQSMNYPTQAARRLVPWLTEAVQNRFPKLKILQSALSVRPMDKMKKIKGKDEFKGKAKKIIENAVFDLKGPITAPEFFVNSELLIEGFLKPAPFIPGMGIKFTRMTSYYAILQQLPTELRMWISQLTEEIRKSRGWHEEIKRPKAFVSQAKLIKSIRIFLLRNK